MSYLVDVNILIYATNADAPKHEQARDWLDFTLAEDEGTVGLPWAVLVGFVRIITHPRGWTPLELREAWSLVEEWRARPAAWSPSPTPRHAEVFSTMLTETSATGNLVTDAHLAALAHEHSLTVVSHDQDFEKFSKTGLVRWFDPLASAT